MLALPLYPPSGSVGFCPLWPLLVQVDPKLVFELEFNSKTALHYNMALNHRATAQEMLPGVDLCLIPAGSAPDGRPPNFVDPPSLQPAVVAITTVMLTLAFLVLAGRLFVNRKSLKLPDCKLLLSFLNFFEPW